MSQKTNIALACAVVLGLAYTGSAWWLGQRAEQRYQEELNRVSQLLGPGVITQQQYQRGLFSAQASFVLDLQQLTRRLDVPSAGDDSPEEAIAHAPSADEADSAAAAEAPAPQPPAETAAEAAPEAAEAATASDTTAPVRLHIASKVQHGPIAGGALSYASVLTELAQVEGLPDALRLSFEGQQKPGMRNTIAFSGAYKGQVHLPAGKLEVNEDDKHMRLTWQPLHTKLTLASDRQHTSGDLKWPGFELSLAQAQKLGISFQFDGMSGDWDVRKVGQQWLMSSGSGQLKAERMRMATSQDGQNHELLSLTDMQAKFSGSASGNLVSTQQSASAKGQLGKLKIDDMHMHTRLEGLPIKVAELLQHMLLLDLRGQTSAADEAKTEALTKDGLTALLQAAPRFEDQYSLSLGGHTGKLRYDLGLKPPADAPAPSSGDGAIEEMLARLSASLELHAPKAWHGLLNDALKDHPLFVPEAGEQDQDPIAPGDLYQAMLDAGKTFDVLVEEETAFVARASFEAGEAKLNGKTVFSPTESLNLFGSNPFGAEDEGAEDEDGPEGESDTPSRVH